MKIVLLQLLKIYTRKLEYAFSSLTRLNNILPIDKYIYNCLNYRPQNISHQGCVNAVHMAPSLMENEMILMITGKYSQTMSTVFFCFVSQI